MKNHYQIDDFTDIFFKMEKEYNLFSLRAIDNLPIWDILRYKVAYELSKTVEPINLTYSKQGAKEIISKIKKIKDYFVSVYNITKPLNKNLFFLTSRNKDSSNHLFDINADSVIGCYNKSEISIIETYTPYGAYKYKGYDIILHSVVYLIECMSNKKNQIPQNVIEEIKQAVNNSFPTKKISLPNILQDEFSKFHSSFMFYKWLFRRNRKNLKRIFVTQNGIQKGLFLAARHHGIKSFEFQHGIIDKTHIAYSYNIEIKYQEDDVINPDTFFSFSNYWSKIIYHPFIQFIPIGNDLFSKKLNPEDKVALTVISSIVHDIELRPFTQDFAKKHPNQKIFYKLHPNQFWQTTEIINFFIDYKNVTVIKNELTVQQLLSKSKAMLVIVSTALYEALHNNTSVIILKSLNYFAHQDVFNNPNVYLISSIEELESSYIKSNNSISNNYDIYFQSFDYKLFNKCISTTQN